MIEYIQLLDIFIMAQVDLHGILLILYCSKPNEAKTQIIRCMIKLETSLDST